MSEPDHNDAEIHASYGKLDAANQEQASLILWKIWGSTRPHFQNPAACQEALNKDPHLFNALKAAHAAGKYGTIRNWGECCSHSHFSTSSPLTQVGRRINNLDRGTYSKPAARHRRTSHRYYQWKNYPPAIMVSQGFTHPTRCPAAFGKPQDTDHQGQA
jgi:hypothetical protein